MLKLSMHTMMKMIDEDQKPGKQDMVTVLRTVTVFVERVIEESKIQTILDEVRKLAIDSSNRDFSIDEKITHIKHQAASLKSSPSTVNYVSVLSRFSTASSITKEIFIISPTIPKQEQALYNKLNEIIIKL